MHYRNGREAKNGDKVIQLSMDETGRIMSAGVLFDAQQGSGDYCNGSLAPLNGNTGACLIDCIHVEDIEAMIKEKGFAKRPV